MSHCLPCSLCCFPTHPAFPVSLSFDLTLIYHWLYLIYCLLRAASLCLQSSPPFLVEWVLLEPCRFSTVCIPIPPGLCHWRLWLELLSRRWISTPVGSQWWRTDFTTKSQLPLDCFPSPVSLSHRFSPHEALLHLNTLQKLPSHPWTYQPACQATGLERLPPHTFKTGTNLLPDPGTSNWDEDPHGQTQMQVAPVKLPIAEPWVNSNTEEIALLCSHPLWGECGSVCSKALCLTW